MATSAPTFAPRIIASGLIAGAMFGFFLEKAKVYLPSIIVGQMLFQNFTMMKMFLAAIGTSAIAMLVMISVFKRTLPCMKSSMFSDEGVAGFGGNILGGFLLGVGMTLGGACPGTVFPQLAAGVPSAPWVLVGGVVGGLVFAALEGLLNRHLAPKAVGFAHLRPTSALNELFGVPMATVSLGLFVMMTAVAATFTYLFNDSAQITPYLNANASTAADVFSLAWWPPALCGSLAGLVNFVPLYHNFILGTSTSFCTAASFLVPSSFRTSPCPANQDWQSTHDAKYKVPFPYLGVVRTVREVFQISLIVGIVLGAFASIHLSGIALSAKALAECPSMIRAFFGGFFLILGSRIAWGCASGHGISGMGRLSVASCISVCGMFGGGILTAVLLR